MLGTSPRLREPTVVHPDEQIWNGVLLELDDEELSSDLMRMAAVSTTTQRNDTFIPLSCSAHGPCRLEEQKALSGRLLCQTSGEKGNWSMSARSIRNGRYSPDESSIALLEYPGTGFRFDLIHPELECSKTQIRPGTLLKPLSELDDPRIVDFLRRQHDESRRKDALLARDVLNPCVYAVVPKTNVMRLTDDQAMLLLAIECEQRVPLYKDFERFDFLSSLREGDAVFVQDSNKMYSGRISRVGERPYCYGTWYNIEIPVSWKFALDFASHIFGFL
ncbi:hypothetical protein COOONC_28622 [Cooperia oncophora]